jgi:hypothetical protein
MSRFAKTAAAKLSDHFPEAGEWWHAFAMRLRFEDDQQAASAAAASPGATPLIAAQKFVKEN